MNKKTDLSIMGIVGWLVGIGIFIFIEKSPASMLATMFMILGHYVLSESQKSR